MGMRKGYSPLRRWLREERVCDWPVEAARQQADLELERQGWRWDWSTGLGRRIDKEGRNIDTYYIGTARWDDSPIWSPGDDS